MNIIEGLKGARVGWDYDHNDIDPKEISTGSSRSAHFICLEQNHTFTSIISNLFRKKPKCPYCYGKSVLPGFNDVATTHPEIVSLWSKDNIVNPEEIKSGSHRIIKWECIQGHTYERPLRQQVENTQCPICNPKRKSVASKTLDIAVPDSIHYWDYDKNEKYPYDFKQFSNIPVWWVCDNSHSYELKIQNFSKGVRCPYCDNRKVLSGFNDLSYIYPEVAQFFSSDNNLTPDRVIATSSKKFIWECNYGHQWECSIDKIVKYGQCPVCKKIDQQEQDDFHQEYGYLRNFWSDTNNIDFNFINYNTEGFFIWNCIEGHQTIHPLHDVIKGVCCSECVVGLLTGDIFIEKGSFASIYGENIAYWDMTKNGNHSPFVYYKDHVPVTILRNNQNNKSLNRGISYDEYNRNKQEIYNFILDCLQDVTVIKGDKQLLKNDSVDIYVPDKNIAFDINNPDYHTEKKGKGRNYHYNKWKKCHDSGVQLITIWEDEWIYKKSIIQNMIKHKLNISSEIYIYARKTHIKEINKDQARDFLDTHHIQGYVSGSKYYALINDVGSIVAVSVWKKIGNILYLDRYATSCNVVGGMGKLLKYGKNYATSLGLDKIVTFADHCVSNGGLYEKLHFKKDGMLAPDYKYVVKGKRVHKFNYRKKRFKQDAHLLYEDGLTEKQLADLNGLERIWDCGKTRYILNL